MTCTLNNNLDFTKLRRLWSSGQVKISIFISSSIFRHSGCALGYICDRIITLLFYFSNVTFKDQAWTHNIVIIKYLGREIGSSMLTVEAPSNFTSSSNREREASALSLLFR